MQQDVIQFLMVMIYIIIVHVNQVLQDIVVKQI
jgi:hypothetical protein